MEILLGHMLTAQNRRSGSRERHQARGRPEVREEGDVGLAAVERSLELADEHVRVFLGPVAEHAVVDDVERAEPRSEDRLVAELAADADVRDAADDHRCGNTVLLEQQDMRHAKPGIGPQNREEVVRVCRHGTALEALPGAPQAGQLLDGPGDRDREPRLAR